MSVRSFSMQNKNSNLRKTKSRDSNTVIRKRLIIPVLTVPFSERDISATSSHRMAKIIYTAG